MSATYDSIATVSLGSPTTTITFSSIPGSFTDLRLLIVGRSDSTGNTSVGTFIRYNNDAGGNYSRTALFTDGASAVSSQASNATEVFAGHLPASSGGFSSPGLGQHDIFSYTGSNNKTSLSNFSSDRNGAGFSWFNAGMWRNASAITRIDIFPAAGSWVAGTTATLYGILRA